MVRENALVTPFRMVKYDEEKRDLGTLQRQRKEHEVRRTSNPIKAVQTFLFDRVSLGSMALVRFGPIIDISCLSLAECTGVRSRCVLGTFQWGLLEPITRCKPLFFSLHPAPHASDLFVREPPPSNSSGGKPSALEIVLP